MANETENKLKKAFYLVNEKKYSPKVACKIAGISEKEYKEACEQKAKKNKKKKDV